MENNRLELLQKIESGELTPEDGLALLHSAEAEIPANPGADGAEAAHPMEWADPGEVISMGAPADAPVGAALPDFSRFRAISWIVFALFLILTVLSASWMVQGYLAHPFGLGFWLSWIPFAIGVLGMAGSLNAHWLHLRVSEMEDGKQKNIRISLPLPLGMIGWILKLNPGWLPREVRGKNIGETIADIHQSIRRDQPFFLEVHEDNQHVEIYIG